ncbi:MAG: hypothetical protein ACTSXT_09915 [Candidatus Helarchaeota archaeon]
MLVIVKDKTIEECKNEVNEFLKGKSFHEVGGYLIGTYDYDASIELFFLDKKAESTSTRIKLSSDSFLEVEKLLTKFPNFQYLGTWHVHPGKGLPIKSEIDEATLFLERFVIETDNPEQYKCPRIHIIFNENFTEMRCYTMNLDLDYELFEVESMTKSNLDLLDIINIIKEKLNEIEISNGKIDLDDLEDIYNNLVEIRDMIDGSLDSLESLFIFEEFKEIFYNNTENIENIILSNIRNNVNIGILTMTDKKVIIGLPYHPEIIDSADVNSELFGFWKYFPYTKIDLSFEKIFLTNFYLKTKEEYSNQFFYFRCNKELRIEPFVVRFNSYDGLRYDEVELNIIKDSDF